MILSRKDALNELSDTEDASVLIVTGVVREALQSDTEEQPTYHQNEVIITTLGYIIAGKNYLENAVMQ